MKNTIFVAAVLLSGCASSGVSSIGQDTYMISDRASNGYTSAGSLKANIYREGVAFCKKQGKEFQPTRESTVDGVPNSWRWASAEIQFRCLRKGDSELGRPTFKKDADITIEQKIQDNKEVNIKHSNDAKNSNDIYTELKKLKELLDLKIITREEFEAQKKNILAR